VLRFDSEAGLATRAADNAERREPVASDDAWIRWAPVFVPLSGGAVLATAFVIWSAVL
jgi:hypothetical protein